MSVSTEPRLRFRAVRKTFGTTTALASLDLDVEAGEIHALVGQNGSGKSTLVKILAGVYRPEEGSKIRVAGQELRLPIRPAALREAGVSFVHQDLGLIAEMTITQNIAIGGFAIRRDRVTINWTAERRRAADLMARLEVDVHPDTLLSDLGPADRSRVAIARALRAQTHDNGVLVLDEPSRALPPAALEDFHRTIGRVAASGTAVLLISHNLEEVVKLSDRVSVLRDGMLVGTLDTRRSNEQEIANLMLGHAVSASRKTTYVSTADSRAGAIEVSDLSIKGRDVPTFTIGAGEVVGLTGLSGDIWEQVPYAVAGATKVDSGELRIAGHSHEVRSLSLRRAIRLGISLIPERRAEEGLALERTVSENVLLPWLSGNKRLVRQRHSRDLVRSQITGINVQPPDPDAIVGKLSGGNQQKVLLGKWLFRTPTLLAMHEPTQAVDVGARETILAAVRTVAAQGTAVLFASMQPADLIEACDRVLALRDGAWIEITTLSTDALLDAVYAKTTSTNPQRIPV